MDLHRFTVEEALIQLDFFLNRNPDVELMLIHGEGSGKLKHAIREYLNKHDLVRKVHPGEELNLPGGSGVTVVEVEDFPYVARDS